MVLNLMLSLGRMFCQNFLHVYACAVLQMQVYASLLELCSAVLVERSFEFFLDVCWSVRIFGACGLRERHNDIALGLLSRSPTGTLCTSTVYGNVLP